MPNVLVAAIAMTLLDVRYLCAYIIYFSTFAGKNGKEMSSCFMRRLLCVSTSWVNFHVSLHVIFV